ncbi:TetR/AcrR family transcriptional regulator [Massilia sp. DWR3-1-1]|uniref:TetR/AcrR family transcriptional regulator n=1 Tax=Massilia sp. DWR3-1-1 TaxID=2804559 RepID=UPI003CEA1CB3
MSKSPNTADNILACARTLIVAGGYNGFSYADIADVVGIRKASIHHHFPAKADLVRTLVAGYRRSAEDGLLALARAVPAPLDQLRSYVGYWKSCIGDASAPFCVCAMLAGELPGLPADVALEVRAHFRFLAGWLQDVLERGIVEHSIVPGQGAHIEAQLLMATVHGAMLSARAYGDTAVFGTIVDAQLSRLSTRT